MHQTWQTRLVLKIRTVALKNSNFILHECESNHLFFKKKCLVKKLRFSFLCHRPRNFNLCQRVWALQMFSARNSEMVSLRNFEMFFFAESLCLRQKNAARTLNVGTPGLMPIRKRLTLPIATLHFFIRNNTSTRLHSWVVWMFRYSFLIIAPLTLV